MPEASEGLHVDRCPYCGSNDVEQIGAAVVIERWDFQRDSERYARVPARTMACSECRRSYRAEG